MTNTLLHLRKFKQLKIKKRKKKGTQGKANANAKANANGRGKTKGKARNAGGRKAFLPRALSGTLPKLKIKKKKKKCSSPKR
ncbi:hypothetical protein PVMG_06291 [Plasmodium vivax Mauritania I]|uniref:Uncharacterized protein n=2 Tax=Plasmodium vivax TaxID=5855 RepID=A0A0J9W5M5_PLAVI|nr:hypothetical protein PVMG_06291 [Plasmodium vivax Mauritania I]KNA02519.1 hypothetical protein PVNG_06482 [Plasmodium vivax North Korean]